MGRAIQILRLIGVLLCALSVVLALATPTSSAGHADTPVALNILLPWALSASMNRLIGVLIPVSIAAMFWHSTSAIQLQSPNRVSIALLSLQTLFAFLAAEELQFVVAVEAGLLLSTRTGALWVATQAVAAWLMAALHPELMSWVMPEAGPPAQRLTGIAIFMLVAMLYNFLAFSLGLLAAAEGRQRRALELANHQLQAAQRSVAEGARLAERLRLARELHDAIGHQLTALSIGLQIASRLSQDRARPHIVESYRLAGVLLSDVRSVVSATRIAEATTLSVALHEISSRIATPEIHLDLVPVTVAVNQPLGHALLRCAQEVITNAVKHSAAAHIWIVTSLDAGHLTMTTWDDGTGSPRLAIGNGLRGIEERLRDLSGTCQFRNKPGAGFEITLRAPFIQ